MLISQGRRPMTDRPVSSMSPSAEDPRIAFFDGQASTWDDDVERIERIRSRLEALRSRLPFEPGQELLEVGCGTGQITDWLRRQVAPGRVTALDFAPAMLAKARSRGIPGVTWLCVDVCADALPSSAYDVVFCFHSFPHFRDRVGALRNLSQALRPAGRFVVMHLLGSEQVNRFHSQVGGPVAADHLPDPNEWPGLLAAAGLSLLSLVDQDDLFLLTAVKAARAKA